MEQALIGLFGLLLGISVSEYFRRSSRIEIYAKDVFERRLHIYETLYNKISKAQSIAGELFINESFSKEERKAIWSKTVLGIANYLDDKSLYIHEEISVHCMMAIIGVDEFYYIEDKQEKELSIQQFRDNCNQLLKMIKDETGLSKIEKHFGTITKSKRKSEFIEYYRTAKKRYEKEGTEAFKEDTE